MRSSCAGAEHSGSAAPSKPKLRLRNDTFYDDYLHRGGDEEDGCEGLAETPLRHMSYYDYGAHVRVVEGDPYNLLPKQYAFASHHGKHDNYVQELRPAPVVPYINGFTMPTECKDAETNACFKQVLLRPHHCPGPGHCHKVAFAHAFCSPLCCGAATDPRSPGMPLSFVAPWKHFFAQERSLAQAADERLGDSGASRGARRCAVLSDATCLRQWWLPEAVRGGHVHQVLVPMLTGERRHASDNGLHGSWRRRSAAATMPPNPCDDLGTQHHLSSWWLALQAERAARPCCRVRLPHELVWKVLRSQGSGRTG